MPTDPNVPTPIVQPTYTPVDPAVIQSMLKMNEAVTMSSLNLNSLTHSLESVQHNFTDFSRALNTAGIGLANISDLTSTSASRFGLLATAMIGTKESFKSFGNVDTSKLTTFNSQIDELFETLSRPGTAIGVATNAIKSVSEQLLRAGANPNILSKAVQMGIPALAAYAKHVLTAADNQLRLQNAMLQMATQSGSLSDFYNKIGSDMTLLNDVSARQTKVLSDTSKATGINIDVVSSYAGALSEIPGAFIEMNKGTIEASGTTNILTKTLQFAIGSGRDFKTVASDMKKAVSSYTLSVDDSLKFVARMTEISSLMGAQIDDVRGALNNSADAFKMFTAGASGSIKITQGMSEVMTQYVQSLKSSGVPIQNAIQMFGTMSSAMSNMRVEQKAFLSAQTGGPGGLMGAFQIDKMLKDGDIKGVFDKVQTQIRKQLGNIVTLDEATKSPQAALQMERQIMLLKQGPLGQFAKTDQEAQRLLESMQKGKVPEQLGKESNLTLENAVSKGTKIQELSYSELTKINTVLQEIQLGAGTPVLNTLQNSLTIRSGSAGGNANEDILNQRKKLQDFQQSGINTDTSENVAVSGIKDLQKLTQSLPVAISAAAQGLKDGLIPDKRETMPSNKQLQDSIAAKKEGEKYISNVPVNRNQQFTKFDSEFDGAGVQVGAAAQRSQQAQRKNTVQNTTNNNAQQQQSGPIPVTLSGNNTLTVNFTGTCPHCGDRYTSSEHARLNPASVAGY